MDCKICKGTGRKSCPRCAGEGRFLNGEICTYCQGNGFVKCDVCDGTGEPDNTKRQVAMFLERSKRNITDEPRRDDIPYQMGRDRF